MQTTSHQDCAGSGSRPGFIEVASILDLDLGSGGFGLDASNERIKQIKKIVK